MQLITITNIEIKDGSIQIPKDRIKEIKALQNPSIIIVGETQEVAPKKKRRKLTSLKVKTKGLVFNRDEANAR